MGAGTRSPIDDGPDTASVGAIEVLGMIMLIVIVVILMTTFNASYQIDGGNSKVAYENVDQAVEDYVRVGDAWCCPEDPSAASMLQDLGFQAWAGHTDPIEEVFGPFFPAQEATEFTLTAGWIPRQGLTMHHATLYEPYDAQGMRAGAQYMASHATKGPAFVVPRLENVSGAATADVHYLPLGKDGAYRANPDDLLAPVSWLDATITYTRTAATAGTETTGETANIGREDGPEADERELEAQIEVERAKHVPVVQGPGPGLSLVFQEPDWTSLAGQLPDQPDTREVDRDRQMVVTEDELLSERAIQDAQDAEQGELLPGEDEEPDNPYPHHSFQIETGFHGPGWVNTTRSDTVCGDAGTNTTTAGAYRLIVTVPRDWTEAGTLEDDDEHNEFQGWSEVLVEPLPDGSTQLSSLLSLELELRCPTDPDAVDPGTARWVVPEETTVTRTFRFHARPPAYANSTDLGFQTVHARLDDLGERVHTDGQLVFELANNPGRVHRSVEILTPKVTPVTATSDTGIPKGVGMPVAVVMLNGGEDTDIEHVTLEGPDGFFTEETDDLPTLEQTYPVPASPQIDRSEDGTRLELRFHTPLRCPALKACGVLLRVGVDGADVAQGPLPPPAHLAVLYQDGAVGAYVDRYVRTDDGHGPVPANVGGPGSAMAHRTSVLRPGEAPGAYLWSLAPSTDALCDEADLRERDRAPWASTPDGFVYDDGPRETGYPWFGDDPPPTGPECPAADPPSAWRFPIVAHTGDTSQGQWGVQSVGQGAYRYVDGLPEELIAAWRNGVAESGMTGPSQASPGQQVTLDLGVEALMDQLVATSVSKADIRVHVVDPYNAWEDLPWTGRHLKISENIRLYGERGMFLPGVDVTEYCDASPDDRFRECNVPPAEAYTLSIDLPENMVLGTHLAIAEVAWQVDEDVLDREEEPVPEGPDEPMWQTAHLIHPLDVVTPRGEQGMVTTVGGTAWMRDWG